jgi:hypothetical protein
MPKTDGTIEFKGLTYSLTRKDVQIISDALAILSPDDPKEVVRASNLSSIFVQLLNQK